MFLVHYKRVKFLQSKLEAWIITSLCFFWKVWKKQVGHAAKSSSEVFLFDKLAFSKHI